MIEFQGKKLLYNAGIETIKEYNDREFIKKKTPKVRLLVAPFFLPFMPIELVSEDYGGLIQSMQFLKGRSTAGGMCTITIAGDTSRIEGLGKISNFLNDLWSKTGVDYRDVFKPMTFCQVWYDGYQILMGYVTKCRRTAQPGHITYSIDIDELGNILQNNIVSIDQILWGTQQQVFQDPTTVFKATATQPFVPTWLGMMIYLNMYMATTLSMGVGGPWTIQRMSDGLPLAFRILSLPPPLGAVSMMSLVSQLKMESAIFQDHAGSSFFDFLRSVTPSQWCELWVETGGRTICTGRMITSFAAAAAITPIGGLVGGLTIPTASIGISALLSPFSYIVSRTNPYDVPWTGISPWEPMMYPFMLGILDLIMAGDFVIVTDSDIISKDLGQSCDQQYSYFHVDLDVAKNVKAEVFRASIARGPLSPLHSGGIKTYGLKKLSSAMPTWSSLSLGLVGKVLETVEKNVFVPAMATIFNTWMRNAAKFTEGSITTRAYPYARPGMYLLYLPSPKTDFIDCPRELGAYYIDQVAHTYTLGKADTTTFTLIRGTPLPTSIGNILRLMADWELLTPGTNLSDFGI